MRTLVVEMALLANVDGFGCASYLVMGFVSCQDVMLRRF